MMTNLEILLVVIVTGLSIGIAIFQYRNGLKKKEKSTYFYILLRSLIFIIIGLLLIDLSVTSTTTKVIKPQLAILADNSSSLKNKVNLSNFKKNIQQISENNAISDRFFTNTYQFGDRFKKLDSLNFKDKKTNIHKGLNTLSDLYSSDNLAVVLLTDGYQNYGPDFANYAKNQGISIYPVAIGDTATYRDLKINRINNNDYSYLGNEFPVEILINYDGKSKVNSLLKITNNNQVLFSKKITLDKDEKSAIINAKIKAKNAGLQKYKVRLTPIDNEKNIKNNERNFQIDVIDDKAKILLLTSIIHPDLGALKKSLETNEQREVIINTADEFDGNFDDFKSVILYQPERGFSSYMDQLEKKNASLLIIGGEKTDYELLSDKFPFFQKSNSQTTENYQGFYNDDFQKFQFDDLGFSRFPPLSEQFSDLQINGNYSTLLFRSIDGIKTESPLLFEKESGNRRFVFLMGEGIWKWRGEVFRQRESFRAFDRFLDKWIQYLNVDERERLEVEAKKLYKSGLNGKITARYYDANYQFDPRAKLKIKTTDSLGDQKTYDMPLINNQFTFDINTLDQGVFSYEIIVENQTFQKKGRFRIKEFSIENIQYGANVNHLKSVAKNNKIYTLSSIDQLIVELSQNKKFQPVQKSTQNKKSLINWYYLLVLLIVFLGLEWLLRKYNGLI
jgi:hypothetical protein